MVAGGIIHEDWLNDNRNRRYPFFDDASMMDDTNTLRVPNELIVDLVLPVQASQYDPGNFFLQRLTVFAGGVIIVLAYDDGSVTTAATRAITEAEHTENKSYYIEGSGAFSDTLGRITIGRFDAIKKFGGTYEFSAPNTQLLPTVIRPSLQGVTGARTVNANNEQSALLVGDIELLAGDNIQFVVVGNKVTISALPSTAFGEDCDCPEVSEGDCIKTINGVGPDIAGDFFVTSGDCLSIEAIANGLNFNDTCADPCCGCAELETLRLELNRVGGQVTTQRAFAQRAMANIEQIRDVVLSSKLGTIVPC